MTIEVSHIPSFSFSWDVIIEQKDWYIIACLFLNTHCVFWFTDGCNVVASSLFCWRWDSPLTNFKKPPKGNWLTVDAPSLLGKQLRITCLCWVERRFPVSVLGQKDKLPLSPSKGMSVRMDRRPENIAERFSGFYI